MPEEKLEFVYELEGNLETLDVFDLATSLEAMGRVIREANRVLYPQEPAVQVSVRPVQKGSYEIPYVLSYVVENAGPLFVAVVTIPGGLEKISNVLGDLGVIKKGYDGVIQAIAKLRGKPKKVEQIDKHTFHMESDNGAATVKGNVKTLMTQPIIIENLTINYSAPLERPGIEDIKSFLRGQPATAVTVTKEDGPRIREFAESVEEPLADKAVESVNRAFLKPRRGPFGADGKQWWFDRGNQAIRVTIKDKKFLENYGSGHPRLNAEDVLEVQLREKQTVSGSKVSLSYEAACRGPRRRP
jgi:hypothetical protein